MKALLTTSLVLVALFLAGSAAAQAWEQVPIGDDPGNQPRILGMAIDGSTVWLSARTEGLWGYDGSGWVKMGPPTCRNMVAKIMKVIKNAIVRLVSNIECSVGIDCNSQEYVFQDASRLSKVTSFLTRLRFEYIFGLAFAYYKTTVTHRR